MTQKAAQCLQSAIQMKKPKRCKCGSEYFVWWVPAMDQYGGRYSSATSMEYLRNHLLDRPVCNQCNTNLAEPKPLPDPPKESK